MTKSCFVNGAALIKREEFQSHLCFTTVGLCSEHTLKIKLKAIKHELTCFSAKFNYGKQSCIAKILKDILNERGFILKNSFFLQQLFTIKVLDDYKI